MGGRRRNSLGGEGSPVLSTFTFRVAGTHHEGRQKVIRLLSPENPVSLWKTPVIGKDQNAIAVVLEGPRGKKSQIGWVPWVMNRLLLQMDLRQAEIVKVGTDEHGRWTHVSVKVHYVPNRFSKELEVHGPYVAGVLDRMLYKNVRFARQIADLPTEELQLAIEEYDTEGMMEQHEFRKSSKRKKNGNQTRKQSGTGLAGAEPDQDAPRLQ